MAEQPIGPGTLLAGRFRLEDLLDETDGARFWRATDRILARNVAVHVIPQDDRRADAVLVAARTSATVTDGHLLRVLDAAEEDGVVYVVNEWGSGMSLDRILADGPLSARRAAWVVKEVAEAITTAHRAGVAHGRLLPENVMVTEAGSVKLIGFVVDAVLRGREDLRLGGRGPLGEHESDVVNLAALLYASLTGRWPGTAGSTLPDAPLEHDRPLRPRQVRAGVPRPLDAICDRVLAPGSHGHAPPIETAHEIFAALADYVGDPSGAAQVGFEPTSVIGAPDRDADLDQDGPPTQAHPGPAAATPGPGEDPERTQAGAPVFYDQDSGVGWMNGAAGRGLRSDDPDAGARRPPPPPPVLPEPEPRPLFAPDPPEGRQSAPHRALGARHTATTPPVPRSTGPGNGSLPRTWGPDADQPPPPENESGEWGTSSWEKESPGGSWMRLAAAVAGLIVLVVALVFAFNLGRGADETTTPSPGEQSSAPASTGKPVDISAVSDFDPEGDPPEENPEEAPLAIDGNPSTAWQTLTYTRPNLGGLKSGVGLLVDLGKPTQVSKAQVKLIGSRTSVDLLAAPEGASAPTAAAGLDKVASAPGAGTVADLRLDKPVTTQYLVVWLTSLPPYGGGGFKGQVAEVTVRS